MGTTPELVIGVGALLLAIAMLWFGRPNAEGLNPSLLRNSTAEVLYPVLILVLLVIGGSALIHGSFG